MAENEKKETKEVKDTKAKGAGKKKGSSDSAFAVQMDRPRAPEAEPRLKTFYAEKVVPSLIKDFKFKGAMQVPRITKIVVSQTMKDALVNAKALDGAVEELAVITGQKPKITRSKKSIAAFKLRQGQALGAVVTLRKAHMYEFLDRLINIALPRVRDFKGVNPKSFDGRGNFSMGVKEQIMFPEINYDRVEKIRGMNITITTTATKNEHARALLTAFGMPFRK